MARSAHPALPLLVGAAFALLLGSARPAQPEPGRDAVLARLTAIDRGLFMPDSRLKAPGGESLEQLLREQGERLRALGPPVDLSRLLSKLDAIEARLGRPAETAWPDALVQLDRRLDTLVRAADGRVMELDALAAAVQRLERSVESRSDLSRLERRLEAIEGRLRSIESRLR